MYTYGTLFIVLSTYRGTKLVEGDLFYQFPRVTIKIFIFGWIIIASYVVNIIFTRHCKYCAIIFLNFEDQHLLIKS